MPWNITYGPPGTGKTTDQLNTVDRELKDNKVRPDRIGYFGFTKKSADEAQKRAMQRFSFGQHNLPYFRTIHSLTFKQIDMRKDRVVQFSHLKEVGHACGFDVRGGQAVDDSDYGMARGDRMLFIEGLARASQRPLKDVWQESGETDISWPSIERLAQALALYKKNHGLMDFTDMLEEFVTGKYHVPALDALFLDEAQDLSSLQWRVFEMLAARAQRVYIAGDDDQAIYRWSGADVDRFLSLDGSKRVLGQSYRIPSSVHDVAARIVSRIKNRASKEWKPRTVKGQAVRVGDITRLDLSRKLKENGEPETWLLLARNGYLLESLEQHCKQLGYSYESVGKNPLTSYALKAVISYEAMRKGKHITKKEAENVLKYISPHKVPQNVREGFKQTSDKAMISLADANSPEWYKALDRLKQEDVDYFRKVWRSGEKLIGQPRIKISTIHTVKGGEADNVVVMSDMSKRTSSEMQRKPDDEHRVWYVAVTRAISNLYVVNPQNAATAYQVMG